MTRCDFRCRAVVTSVGTAAPEPPLCAGGLEQSRGGCEELPSPTEPRVLLPRVTQSHGLATRALLMAPRALALPSKLCMTSVSVPLPFVGCLSRAWLFFSVVVCAQNHGTCFLLLQKLSGLLLSVQKSLCLSALVTQGSFVGSRLPDLDNYDLWYNFVLHWEWNFASLSLH